MQALFAEGARRYKLGHRPIAALFLLMQQNPGIPTSE
jgi:hypothetical protein